MASYTVGAGISSFTQTLASNVVDTVTFADRYNYININTNSTGSTYLTITTDGTTPTASGAGSGTSTDPNHIIVMANGLPMWFPSSRVLQQGVIQVGDGAAYNASTNPSTPANPGTVTPMESLAGQDANPGTVVKILSSGTPTYTITGVG
jgi:hypothetical protein